jgi:hypothetical protein
MNTKIKAVTVTSITKLVGHELSPELSGYIKALGTDLTSGKNLQKKLTAIYEVETFTQFDDDMQIVVVALKVANELSGTRKYKDALAFLNAGMKKPLAFYNLVQSEEFQNSTEVEQKRLGSKAIKAENSNADNIAETFSEIKNPTEEESSTTENGDEILTLTMTQKEMDKEGAELIARISNMVMDSNIIKHLRSAVEGK